MGQAIFKAIVGILATFALFFKLSAPQPKQVAVIPPIATVSATLTEIASPSATIAPTQIPTRIPTKILPTKVLTPTIAPTPTIDPQKLSQCNSAFMPVAEFSGHSCLAGDYEMRWIASYNGQPMNQDQLDENFKTQKEGEVRPMLVKECLKNTKEHFEKCSTSIRDNAERIRNELSPRLQSDIQTCLKSSNFANGTMQSNTGRYMAKDRMKGMIAQLYDFCYSHNDSAQDFHP